MQLEFVKMEGLGNDYVYWDLAGGPLSSAGGGSQDRGTQDAGSPDGGSQGGGSQDRGSPGRGSPDSASQDRASPDSASQDRASPDSASQDRASPDSASQDRASPGRGSRRRAGPALDEAALPGLAASIADRHFGVGGDGLVLILPGDRHPLRMRMFNADGSEAEMCGNAIRCVARYARDTGLVTDARFTIETLRRDVGVEILDGAGDRAPRVRADMGTPRTDDNRAELHAAAPHAAPDAPPEPEILTIDGTDYAFTPVSMGNPHAVVFVEDLEFDLAALGPRFEHHPRFPQRTNTEFVVPEARDRLRLRVWERGSGETLACGTGACAAAVAGVLTGRSDRRVTVGLRGGELEIEWSAADNHVYMTGPATYVFSGTYHYEPEAHQPQANQPEAGHGA